ncbi:MAG: hypothetical protein WBM04_03140 [Candidatus Korobacteraceae bacterium]
MPILFVFSIAHPIHLRLTNGVGVSLTFAALVCEDRTVRVETNLYATATPEGELVWTGISDSFNPNSAKKAINGVVKVVVKDLEKEGIF